MSLAAQTYEHIYTDSPRLSGSLPRHAVLVSWCVLAVIAVATGAALNFV